MASRCINCNGIVAKDDLACYSCGEPIPKSARRSSVLPQRRPASKLSNVIFVVSLALTAFSFITPNKPPLSVSLAASGVLILVKVLADIPWRRGSDRRRT